jgi:hypothetical protein
MGRLTTRDKGIQSLLKALDPESPFFSENMSRLIERLSAMRNQLYAQSGERSKSAQGYRQQWFVGLNEYLSRYSIHPQLVNRYPRRPDHSGWELTWFWSKNDNQEICGPNAISVLFELALSDEEQFHRLRRCEYGPCGKWFFADRANQVFCSSDCRYRFHCSDESDKRRRADWAKRNYHNRKDAKPASRQAARRQGAKR